jgi:3-isopropylmalate/(R)-2-methylmalate dehydratase small subunit
MKPFTTLTSAVVSLPVNDIDTDQIIPARFLKTTVKDGLGAQLFCDWRYEADGSPKADFALNRAESQGRRILLAGNNFGCGSSREHAPWALADWGLRAIIAPSFADIFRNNALKNGLLPIAVDATAHAAIAARPDAEVTVDLDRCQLTLPDGRAVTFEVDPFARRCLLQGTDQLGYLLSFADAIAAHEARS